MTLNPVGPDRSHNNMSPQNIIVGNFALRPATQDRLNAWINDPSVKAVVLVGSRSRKFDIDTSDDDLLIVLTDSAFEARSASECTEALKAGSQGVYDATYTSVSAMAEMARSPRDVDHEHFERAITLFDRCNDVRPLISRLADMPESFRRLRLLHGILDTWGAARRARKAARRGIPYTAISLVLAYGAQALARVLFALEWRWVPIAHWIVEETRTLRDPTGAAQNLLEALDSPLHSGPLETALRKIEPQLVSVGLTLPIDYASLAANLFHPRQAVERRVHGIW